MYAATTTVPIEKSRREIEQMLAKYGATQTIFADDWEHGEAVVQFRKNELYIRFVLKMPALMDKRFMPSNRSRKSHPEQRKILWEQGCRQKWRALCLAIKAKFETVENGIGVFETEFLANIICGKGSQTVADVLIPQIMDIPRGQQLIGIGFSEVKQQE